MKCECFDCEATANNSKDRLIDLGWCSFSVEVNGKKLKAQLCPNHSSPKRITELVEGCGPEVIK